MVIQNTAQGEPLRIIQALCNFTIDICLSEKYNVDNHFKNDDGDSRVRPTVEASRGVV